MHLGLDAGNQHLLVQRPQPDGLVLVQRGAGGLGLERLRAQHALGEMLARVHGQLAHRRKLAGAGVPGASRCVHTASLGHRALEHPVWQRCVAQGAAGINVLFHHLGHVQPASLLPQLERALLHAKAPAQAQVHIARVVGNGGQVHGGIVKAVAQNGPQKPALCALAVAQQAQTLGGRLFEHAGVDLVGLLPGRHVLARFSVKAQHIAALLLVKTRLGFLPQVAQRQQLLQHGRRGKAGVKRVGLQAQGVLQRLDHMGHGVQAHHVGGAEGARAGTAHFLAGQVVHHVDGQAKVRHLFHGGEHAGNADPVGDEVG